MLIHSAQVVNRAAVGANATFGDQAEYAAGACVLIASRLLAFRCLRKKKAND